MLKLYVTSTGIKSGKTFISTGLSATMQSLGYSTCVYKPVQTSGIEINGFMQSPDLTFVKTIDPYIETRFTYLFKSSQEPAISAELENTVIDKFMIQHDFNNISDKFDCCVVDGNFGIASPLAPNFSTIALLKFLKLPLLIVVSPDKNSVNNTILTANYAASNGVEIRGAILNDIPEFSSDKYIKTIPRLIEEYTDAKILGIVEHINSNLTSSELISTILNGTDIESVFDIKIEKLGLC